MKIAIIFESLGPYHIKRISALDNFCDVCAIEVNAKSADYLWDPAPQVPFERVKVFDSASTLQSSCARRKETYNEIGVALKNFVPDVVVVPGWSGAYAFIAVLWAHRHSVPIIIMSDSQEIDFTRKPHKEWLKRRYVKNCQGAIVGGRSHREYIVQLGMHPEYVRLGYDVVDNDYFESASDYVRKDSERLRSLHKLPGKYFLVSARFIEKKNLPLLIRSFASYRNSAQERASDAVLWDMVLLGDGELRPEIKSLVSLLGLEGCLHLPGFKQYPELPIYYGLASAFVLPSTTEQWGLVVNEAMASGLPVLVSSRCGCAADLVQAGVNGYTFDPFDEPALTELLCRLSSYTEDAIKVMGSKSREIIADWTPQVFAEQLSDLVGKVGKVTRKPPGVFDRLLLSAFSYL